MNVLIPILISSHKCRSKEESELSFSEHEKKIDTKLGIEDTVLPRDPLRSVVFGQYDSTEVY